MKNSLIFKSLAALSLPAGLALGADGATGSDGSQSITNTPAQTLPRVLVTAPVPQSYLTTNATTATKTDTPLKDIPQAVRVIRGELLQDQAALSVNDVLRNVAGVAPVQNRAGTTATAYFGQILTRGFRSEIYQDGIRQRFFYDVDSEALHNTERVEVLKGPGSELYGLGTLGGLVNYVSKTPQPTAAYSSTTTMGGSTGGVIFKQGADLTGPLNPSGTFMYRLSGELEQSDLFQDNTPLRRRDLSASVLWDNKLDTTVKFDVDARDRRQTLYLGLPFPFTAVPIPITRNPGEPAFNQLHNDGIEVSLDATHRFNDVWSSRTVLRYDVAEYHFAGANSKSLLADGVTLKRSYTDYREDYNESVIEQDFIAKTTVLDHPATTLFGGEFSALFDHSGAFSGKIGTLNLVNQVYGLSSPTITGNNFPFDVNQANYGLFFQQQVQPLDPLHLTAGVRYDYLRERDNTIADGGNNIVTINHAFTWRTGATYDVWGPLSTYASYATSFTPNVGSLNLTDEVTGHPPETGHQYEVGLKLHESTRYSATLGLFELTRQNVLVPDPTSDIGASRLSGKQRSRGTDIDLSVEVARGLNVTASYAYVFATVLEDTSNPIGAQLNNVPRHQASLWTRYDFENEGPLGGWFVGAGMVYVGKRPGDLANSFYLGDYATMDAVVGRRWKRVTAQVNVKNALDERYYVYADRRSRVYPGEPLTVIATVKVRF
jgi:iron complex outermembrane receptor protein